jgi:hypothetical protein
MLSIEEWCIQCGYSGQKNDSHPSGMSRIVEDFIKLLRLVCNLKFISCYFWNFPFNIFRLSLTLGK